MSDNISVLAAATVILIARRRRRRRLMEKRKKKTKNIWSRQWLLERSSNRGIKTFVIDELELNDVVGFQGFLRMSPAMFNSLLERIEPVIRLQDTVMRESISPHEMLVVTLRFLATGSLLTKLRIQLYSSYTLVS